MNNREGNVKQYPSKVVRVKVGGDVAIAMVSDAGRPVTPVRYKDVEGQWKLDHMVQSTAARPTQ